MDPVSREQLHAYLEDALADSDSARVERALRDSAELRQLLQVVRDERDRGEHSLGAIWRRERLSCPSREELNGFVHGILESNLQQYIDFHLRTIACSSCQANLDDLRERQAANNSPKRRRKIVDSSSDLLKGLTEDAR